MAPSAGQHRTDVDMVDETDDGGQIHYRWSCLCRRVGRWTEDREVARRAGVTHERRYQPRRPGGPESVRNLLKLG